MSWRFWDSGAKLNLEKAAELKTACIYFFVTFVVFSIVAAVLLQALHELARKAANKWMVSRWLRKERSHIPGSQKFIDEIGYPPNALFSLPYWQLTGQLNAALASQLNIYPNSLFVDTLAGVRPKTQASAEEKTHDLRDAAARAQAGVNALHAHLRDWWNKVDYCGAFLIVFVITCLMTTLESTQNQRFFLYPIAICAWLATPIVRRMIERLVPFR